MMALNINDALRSGFQQTVSRESVGLVAVLLAFQMVNTVIGQSFNRQLFQEFGVTTAEEMSTAPFGSTVAGGGLPFAVDLPLSALAGGLLLTVFLAEAINILGVRMFARETPVTVSTVSLRDGIILTTLNGVIGGTLATIATGLGALLLIVPGVFVAVSLFFVRQEIAIEDKNFIDALSGSWALTRGVRLKVFGLVVFLVVVSLLAGSPATVLFFMSPTVATVIGVVLGSITTVFGLAVTTQAYLQLQENNKNLPAGSTGSVESDDRTAGA